MHSICSLMLKAMRHFTERLEFEVHWPYALAEGVLQSLVRWTMRRRLVPTASMTQHLISGSYERFVFAHKVHDNQSGSAQVRRSLHCLE